MRSPSYTLVLFVSVLCLGCADEPPSASPGNPPSGPASAADEPSPPHAPARIKAVTLDAVDRPADSTLRAIADLGATHLVLVSFGFQPAAHDPRIRMHTGADDAADWYSETDAGIRALSRRADSLGMGLVLKPHLWVGREGQARADISFDRAQDWQAWQQQYHRFLMHYAQLADEVEADLLVVGTELAGTSTAREAFWRGLIEDVRAVYDGKLTYAANWHEEYESVPFWDALDYVGVQGYFPLSQEESPSVSTLRAGWNAPLTTLRHVAARAARPVFFTELGYRSAQGTAAEPWRWPSDGDTPAPRLQARLFEAFFAEVWPRPWVGGVALWKWPTDRERHRAVGFTPQGKPAAATIRRGFD